MKIAKSAYPIVFCLFLAWAVPAQALETEDLLVYGYDYAAAGEPEKALQAFNEVVAREPGNSYARNRQGYALIELGQPEKALAGFEEVLSLDPANLMASQGRALALLRLGKKNEAEAQLRDTLELDPADARTLILLGWLELASSKPEQALEKFRKAQANPNLDDALSLLLGKTFVMLKFKANAKLELEQTLAYNPREVQALGLLGRVYFQQGQGGLALSSWRQALAFAPKNNLLRQEMGFALASEALRDMLEGRPGEASRSWREAISTDPSDARALHYLGGAGRLGQNSKK